MTDRAKNPRNREKKEETKPNLKALGDFGKQLGARNLSTYASFHVSICRRGFPAHPHG